MAVHRQGRSAGFEPDHGSGQRRSVRKRFYGAVGKCSRSLCVFFGSLKDAAAQPDAVCDGECYLYDAFSKSGRDFVWSMLDQGYVK